MLLDFEVFFDVEPDPTMAMVNKGLERINSFKPDTIIALGGGSPMDAAKIMWLLYEHPEIDFDKIDEPWGMDIVITTTANTDAEAKALLTYFNMPFNS